MTNVINIGDRIKTTRESAGLTQAQLAKLCGISQSTIGNLESGIRKSPRHLLTIAQALNVDPMWLQYGGTANNKLQANENVSKYLVQPKEWPFKTVTHQQWTALSSDHQRLIEAQVMAVIEATAPKQIKNAA